MCGDLRIYGEEVIPACLRGTATPVTTGCVRTAAARRLPMHPSAHRAGMRFSRPPTGMAHRPGPRPTRGVSPDDEARATRSLELTSSPASGARRSDLPRSGRSPAWPSGSRAPQNVHPSVT